MKKKIKIPNFKNLNEEARFWETHPVTDFEDVTEVVDIVFELDKPKKESLILRVQKDMKRKLEKVARKKKVSVSTLSRIWLSEKLQAAGL
ncbi:MAG: hypothetical protein UU32_C0015G0006 [Candidatus Woesebacteria bacterium GW2011_GWB1_41_10]|uniref:Uncharacterized protein n=1 Tax=Candidatus Woesebacteria bacterium GW2011_GWB1_41_10 TaxID=1618577 RepID=A0A0G0WPQ0_9BACT|nr:MAG: hypothetical protein UU32_C0015G0006 [Candidatus Woesebacteria bacterium GW2011_GWB1_41_10]